MSKLQFLVRRIFNNKEGGYCIGKLYYRLAHTDQWKYFCDTLEDTDRGLESIMTPEYIRKVKDVNRDGNDTNDGLTAIPTGMYKLHWSYSPKYKRIMPLIKDVPGFSGIRIHSGNTHQDTFGCILLGENKVKGKVINSRIWCDKFDKEFKHHKTASILIANNIK